MKKSVSAIVPIFNEEKTVDGVVHALLKSDLIDEVICINDGSTDKSLDILRGFGHRIQLIDLKQNQGKGFALCEGIRRTRSEIVAFFDADLINLSDEYIETLLNPILNDKARVVLGYPAKKAYYPADSIFSRLTGERAYYKNDLILHIEKMAVTRFGIEVFLNDLFSKEKIKKIPLIGLRGLFKYEKRGISMAFKEYINEAVEITKELAKKEVLSFEDYEILGNLNKVISFKELKDKIGEIKNKKIRRILEKYILKYIKRANHWLEKHR